MSLIQKLLNDCRWLRAEHIEPIAIKRMTRTDYTQACACACVPSEAIDALRDAGMLPRSEALDAMRRAGLLAR